MIPYERDQKVEDIVEEIIECPEGKRIRRHWANLLSPGIIGLVAFLLAIALPVALWRFIIPSGEFSVLAPYLALFEGIYLIFVIEFLFYQWIIWYMDVWVITADRVFDIQLLYLFRQNVGHIPIEQVQDTRVEQKGFFANQLNFGDISVQTAGKESSFSLRSVSSPRTISRVILRLRDMYMEETREKVEEEGRPSAAYKAIGELLIQAGVITKGQLDQALQLQAQRPGQQVGDILKGLGFVTDAQLKTALNEQHPLPRVDLHRYQPDPRAIQCMTKETALRYTALPLEYGEEQVTIAVADPEAAAHISVLSSACGKPVTLVVTEEKILKEMIRKYYGD